MKDNTIRIRQMKGADVRACMRIDADINGRRVWNQTQWHRFHERDNVAIPMATWNGLIVGVALLEMFSKKMRVYRLMVCPWNRYSRVGTALWTWACFLADGKPWHIDVREDDLDAQMFLARMGMKCKLKTKDKAVRHGWLVPETRGESMICRFSITAKQVRKKCSSISARLAQ